MYLCVFLGGSFVCVCGRMLTCKFKIYRYIIYIYNSLCGNGFQHVFFRKAASLETDLGSW